jgi:hypothetical protein
MGRRLYRSKLLPFASSLHRSALHSVNSPHDYVEIDFMQELEFFPADRVVGTLAGGVAAVTEGDAGVSRRIQRLEQQGESGVVAAFPWWELDVGCNLQPVLCP